MAAHLHTTEEHRKRWFFTKEQLLNSPSRADGVEPEKELIYRQQAAGLIKNMGENLNVSALCVSTAVVYMHRFYMIHSFKMFDRAIMATASLFLAAKVEEQPRRLELVAKVSHGFISKGNPPLDTQSEAYKKLVDDITYHELVLLETLGFEVQVLHPHAHVARCTDLLEVSKDLIQTAYFLAHNSQIVTTFCLQHKPTLIAAVCIHLTCKWKGLKIPLSSDNKNWWQYVDNEVTLTKLEELAREFLTVIDKCPRNLKKKIIDSLKMAQQEKLPDGQRSTAGGSSHSRPHPQKSSGSSSSQGSRPPVPDKHHQPPKSHSQSQQAPPSSKQHGPIHHQHKSNSVPHHHPAPASLAHKHSLPPNQGNVHRSTSQGDKMSSTPPPLPHPLSGQLDLHKHHKHKSPHQHNQLKQKHSHLPVNPAQKHTHPPPVPSGQKHPLTDPSQPQKNKRLKVESTSSSHPHSQSAPKLSLADYRQAKRQQTEMKFEPITPASPQPPGGLPDVSAYKPFPPLPYTDARPPPLPYNPPPPSSPPPPPPPPPPPLDT